ncbi:MAG: hypothetical protein MSA26_17040 [Lachnospiraceae bacterium]|nr:hypothetical protein [Lachnospiraceae bacterium]
MSNEIMRREMKEALDAGERALSSLRNAQEKLNSAGNWGLFDMFGGGLFSTIMKRSKMDDAQQLMEVAKTDLKRFQRELKDVNIPLDLRMEVGSFLSFADFFFDGFVADYLVQSKISEAKEQVSDAIVRVEQILNELKRKM